MVKNAIDHCVEKKELEGQRALLEFGATCDHEKFSRKKVEDTEKRAKHEVHSTCSEMFIPSTGKYFSLRRQG